MEKETDLVIGEKLYRIRPGFVRTLALRDEISDSPVNPEAIIQQIRERKLKVDAVTFLQRPLDTLQISLHHYKEWENLAVLKISTYDEWLKKQIHPNTRTNIRKAAKKGLTVRVEPFSDKLVAGLVTLFNETPIRRGKPYPYYGWNCEMVKGTWATQLDQSLWVVAYHEEVLVGFIKLIFSRNIARTSGTVARISHRDKAPMNALLAKCVEVCASRGIPLLVYGNFTYGRKPEDSLAEFKRHNGFEKIDVPRYYIPLSMRGRIGLRLGLHRSLIDVVPGFVLQPVLKLRTKWYEIRERTK